MDVPNVKDGQALVHTLWLSLDPANWIWMSDTGYYMSPVKLA
jgi:NADPH-dependent curcumin reductase CurA